MGSIYKITNTVNQKSYIGKTIHDPEKTRIRQHLNGWGNKPIKKDINEYGEDVFTFEILHDGIIPEFLAALETEEIAKHDSFHNGYNENSGGGGVVSLSDEHRRKVSEALTGEKNPMYGRTGEKHPFFGRKHSDETKQKMSENSAMNRPETRQKVSEAKKGKKRSAETRRNISEARKRPEYYPAREFFFSLPTDMELNEKRRALLRKFAGVPKNTLYRWVIAWTNIRHDSRHPDYDLAREFFLSLPADMPLTEKRHLLRQNITSISNTSLYRWTHKWTKDV